jgi:hypothetical protein
MKVGPIDLVIVLLTLFILVTVVVLVIGNVTA